MAESSYGSKRGTTARRGRPQATRDVTTINNPQLGDAGRRGNEASRGKNDQTVASREEQSGYPVKDTSKDDHPYFGV
jgi:hypothetical protein